jgi:1,4-dihydroxy-2-naphthoate octaprenyltransferase
VAALAYTGGPFPFGYLGLGDLFVFIFFGPAAVGGTYYVQALAVTPAVLAASVPVGALVTAILVVNNLRDIETDRRAGKRTLAVKFGADGARGEYLLLFTLAYFSTVVMWLLGIGTVWILLPWFTVPIAARLGRTILNADDGPTYNSALAGTARLSLLFSLLFAVGLAL